MGFVLKFRVMSKESWRTMAAPKHLLPQENIADDRADTVGIYLHDVGYEPLLTLEQEIGLGQQIETGSRAQDRISRDHLSEVERQQLIEKINQGKAAKTELTTSNLRLVIEEAKKYQGFGVPFLDLIQEGNRGLHRAAEKYEWQKGFKFSSYAVPWIRQKILRALADQKSGIRIPVAIMDKLIKLKKIQDKLWQRYNRDPTEAEFINALVAELEWSPEQAVGLVALSQFQTISLNTPIKLRNHNRSESIILDEAIEDEDYLNVDPPRVTEIKLLREDVKKLLESPALTSREKEVLDLYFGLTTGEGMTLEEIGKKFGVTRKRISQNKTEALKKITALAYARGLDEYLDMDK